jgi:hypothetical protein
MAREFAKMNLSINQDADWRRLPPPAQHLYTTLWNHPSLSYCGVVDWRPGRLTALSHGWTVDDILTAAACLEARLFVVIDHDTEELLIRSYVRFDGLMKQPRVAISYANAYAATASNDIRGVIVYEGRKLRKLEPDLAAWTKPQVMQLLEMEALNPRDRTLPDDPFGDGFPHRFGDSVAQPLGETTGNVWGWVSGSPTTATSTSTSLHLPATRKTGANSSADADGDFEAFWNAYGKKVARGDAKKAWAKAIKKADPERIIAAAEEHLIWHHSPGNDPKFIPHAATWLNGERWNDERSSHASAPTKRSTTDERVQATLAMAARLREQEEAQAPHLRAIGQNR